MLGNVIFNKDFTPAILTAFIMALLPVKLMNDVAENDFIHPLPPIKLQILPITLYGNL